MFCCIVGKSAKRTDVLKLQHTIYHGNIKPVTHSLTTKVRKGRLKSKPRTKKTTSQMFKMIQPWVSGHMWIFRFLCCRCDKFRQLFVIHLNCDKRLGCRAPKRNTFFLFCFSPRSHWHPFFFPSSLQKVYTNILLQVHYPHFNPTCNYQVWFSGCATKRKTNNFTR